MFAPSIARKIIRTRATRALIRAYRTPSTETSFLFPPNELPKYAPTEIQRDGPLYIPQPILQESDFAEEEAQYNLKLRLTKAAENDHPELDDKALEAFYKALVASAVEGIEEKSSLLLEAPKSEPTAAERDMILQKLEARLAQIESLGVEDGSISITEDRLERITNMLSQINLPHSSSSYPSASSSSSSSSRPAFSLKGKEKEEISPANIPIGLVGRSEWKALFDSYIARKDARGAESIIGIMMQQGVRPDEALIHRVMQLDAYHGRIEDVSRLTTAFTELGGELSEAQHNAFITSLLITSPTNVRSALQYLRQHENIGQALPQSSYGVVLKHLTTASGNHQPTSHTRALAWELFTHMRLHGHSTPNSTIYCMMLRACSAPQDPQPERARDLWIEMTEEGNRVQPTRTEYDAIIRALSSTKRTYLEAFDLLREMLAKHRDAVISPFEDTARSLWSPFVPTTSTFIALLEGTKRAGDLERARWILSEVIGLVGSSIEIGQPMTPPNTELLTGVFMTYAAWKSPLHRGSLKVKDERENVALAMDAPNLERITEAGVELSESEKEDHDYPRSPQYSADAVREATAIFQRILIDVQARRAGGGTDFGLHPFASVELTTRLVNSYLSVHLEHAAGIPAMYTTWKDTWKQVQEIDPALRPNGWSYQFLMERCAVGRRKGETAENKALAIQWGKRVWKEYLDWSKTVTAPAEQAASDSTSIVQHEGKESTMTSRQAHLLGLGPRQIEKCWKSVIKLYAMSGHTDTSTALLREFAKRYPAIQVKEGYRPFFAAGMATRIVDVTKLSEPDVSPHLLFEDVEVLHQQLAIREDTYNIGVVKSITTAYAHALLKRKKFRMKNVGVAKEVKKYKKEIALIEKAQKESQFEALPPPADEEDMEGEWDPFMAERPYMAEKRATWAQRA